MLFYKVVSRSQLMFQQLEDMRIPQSATAIHLEARTREMVHRVRSRTFDVFYPFPYGGFSSASTFCCHKKDTTRWGVRNAPRQSLARTAAQALCRSYLQLIVVIGQPSHHHFQLPATGVGHRHSKNEVQAAMCLAQDVSRNAQLPSMLFQGCLKDKRTVHGRTLPRVVFGSSPLANRAKTVLLRPTPQGLRC